MAALGALLRAFSIQLSIKTECVNHNRAMQVERKILSRGSDDLATTVSSAYGSR